MSEREREREREGGEIEGEREREGGGGQRERRGKGVCCHHCLYEVSSCWRSSSISSGKLPPSITCPVS